MENKIISLYAIWADYRPKNLIEEIYKHKCYYLYYARSIKEARQFIKSHLPWLNVYSIRRLNKEERNEEEAKDHYHSNIMNRTWFRIHNSDKGEQ